MSDYSVLVVDDDADIRASICEILCELGYQCSQAPEGNLALCQLDRQPVDLVIIDIFLKSGSGLGVLQAMQAQRLRAKRVVLTNYATADIRRRCAQLGADRVFDKSAELDELLAYCAELATSEPH